MFLSNWIFFFEYKWAVKSSSRNCLFDRDFSSCSREEDVDERSMTTEDSGRQPITEDHRSNVYDRFYQMPVEVKVSTAIEIWRTI